MKKTILPILLSTLWISISEFTRNEFLLKNGWVEHYQSLGLIFPSEPINGAVWGIWSLVFAVLLFVISQKFNFIETTIIGWFIGFIMMWLVIGNLMVLPFGILYAAIPLSILEVFVAVFILRKLSAKS
ncbi:MAG: hypothetical protein JXR34_02480 [Bacteroidales bacterium]|nr:hypothetical protein [Bacteroidales bacterium]